MCWGGVGIEVALYGVHADEAAKLFGDGVGGGDDLAPNVVNSPGSGGWECDCRTTYDCLAGACASGTLDGDGECIGYGVGHVMSPWVVQCWGCGGVLAARRELDFLGVESLTDLLDPDQVGDVAAFDSRCQLDVGDDVVVGFESSFVVGAGKANAFGPTSCAFGECLVAPFCVTGGLDAAAEAAFVGGFDDTGFVAGFGG